MNEAQEICLSKSLRSIPRTNYDVVRELSYERRDVFYKIENLNKAIEANPEAVSAHHKELWRKQAKAMQEYANVLGERIKDLLDNGYSLTPASLRWCVVRL